MVEDHSEKERTRAIRDLYPSLRGEELKEAEENMDRYLDLVRQIYERIREDPAAYASFRELLEKQKETKRKGGDLAHSGK